MLENIKKNAHLMKRPNADLAIRSIETIAEALGDGHPDLEPMLTTLYAFHDSERPGSKAATDVFAWVYQAAGKDDTRLSIYAPYVDGGVLVATDGRRVHWVETTDYPEGYLDKRGRSLSVDWNYPAWRQVVPTSFTSSGTLPAHDIDIKTKVATIDCGGTVLTFQAHFFREAIAGMKSPWIKFNDNKSPVLISDGTRNAVIMPVRT